MTCEFSLLTTIRVMFHSVFAHGIKPAQAPKQTCFWYFLPRELQMSRWQLQQQMFVNIASVSCMVPVTVYSTVQKVKALGKKCSNVRMRFKYNDMNSYHQITTYKVQQTKSKSIFGATSICLQNSTNVPIGTLVQFLKVLGR